MTDKEKQEYIQKLRERLDEKEDKNNLSGIQEDDELYKPLQFLRVRRAKKHWKKAIESLKSANRLYLDKCYNNCVSRSYYAIYQTLATILKEREAFPYNNRSHPAVLEEFRDHCLDNETDVNNFEEIVMSTLRRMRNKSDYLSESCLRNDAKKVLIIAENFIKSNCNGFQESYNFESFQ